MKIITAQQARRETEGVLNIEKYLDEVEAKIYESINEGKVSCFKIFKNIRNEFTIANLILNRLLELGYEVRTSIEEDDVIFEIKW